MLRLVLAPHREKPLRLLCLGAHADDIEIGCGGTILRLVAEVPDLSLRWIVLSGARADRENDCELPRPSGEVAHASASTKKFGLPRSPSYFGISYSRTRWSRKVWCARSATSRWSWCASPFQCVSISDGSMSRLSASKKSLISAPWKGKYRSRKFNTSIRGSLVFCRKVAARPRWRAPHSLARPRGWFNDETFKATARLRGIGCRAPEGHGEAFYAGEILVLMPKTSDTRTCSPVRSADRAKPRKAKPQFQGYIHATARRSRLARSQRFDPPPRRAETSAARPKRQ